MIDRTNERIGYQQPPVVLSDLAGLSPKPDPDCGQCQAWAKDRDRARARNEFATAALLSEKIWRHKVRKCRP